MGSLFALNNMSADAGFSRQVPERELLLAVLDRCVLDFHGSNPKLSSAAREWLFDDDERDDDFSYEDQEFSFAWICHFLGFEKEPLRDCIRALDLRGKAPQGHRWLRSKIKSVEHAYA